MNDKLFFEHFNSVLAESLSTDKKASNKPSISGLKTFMESAPQSELVTNTVTAPAHWASYLINGDATAFSYYDDEEDEQACYALEKKYGYCVDAKEVGFKSKPDYGQAGECMAYTFQANENSGIMKENDDFDKIDRDLVNQKDEEDDVLELDDNFKESMQDVALADVGKSLKTFDQDGLYDIIKFLRGYDSKTVADAIEKMSKWNLDKFTESKISLEMGLNESSTQHHSKQKTGEYVGSKKINDVAIDYYVKYKVSGKDKMVDKIEARFGEGSDDVLILSGKDMVADKSSGKVADDKIFGHLYDKLSDNLPSSIKPSTPKDTETRIKRREENYKEYEAATKLQGRAKTKK